MKGDKMNIYIASSWKNAEAVLALKSELEEWGHIVDAFVDVSNGRYVFSFSEIGNVEQLNAINFLHDERAQKAFTEDRKWLDWCDCCLLLLPAGKSAHLEAGYAKGQNKKLVIYQTSFPVGEFDVMYGFADLISDDLFEIKKFLTGEDIIK